METMQTPYTRAEMTDRIERIAATAVPIFRLNDWRYGAGVGQNGGLAVPTADRIAETIAALVDYVERGTAYARSGRFVVTRMYDGDVSIALELAS